MITLLTPLKRLAVITSGSWAIVLGAGQLVTPASAAVEDTTVPITATAGDGDDDAGRRLATLKNRQMEEIDRRGRDGGDAKKGDAKGGDKAKAQAKAKSEATDGKKDGDGKGDEAKSSGSKGGGSGGSEAKSSDGGGNGGGGGDVILESGWPSFTAKHELGNRSAHDDGSINEWAPGYYIAHNGTAPGNAIAASNVGDVIIIDGNAVTITSRFMRDLTDGYEQVRIDAGDSAVIFQTCLGDDVNNIMLTGTCPTLGPFHDEHVKEWAAAWERYNAYNNQKATEEAQQAQQAWQEQSYDPVYIEYGDGTTSQDYSVQEAPQQDYYVPDEIQLENGGGGGSSSVEWSSTGSGGVSVEWGQLQ